MFLGCPFAFGGAYVGVDGADHFFVTFSLLHSSTLSVHCLIIRLTSCEYDYS